MVGRRKVETKKAKSVLRSNSKLKLLGRPVGLVCHSVNYPEKHCIFASNYIMKEKKEN